MTTDYVELAPGRLALILAAERLFAQEGLQGVSLRKIHEAAGQRNTSAIQYHFGSREGILEAVIAHRMSYINVRRVARIEEMDRRGQRNDIRIIMSALVHPLAEELVPRREGNYYLRFLERLSREHPVRARKELKTGWTEMVNCLRQALVYLPELLIDVRIRLVSEQIVSGLASAEALVMEDANHVSTLSMFVEALIDSAVASVQAPVSFQTLKTL